MGKRPFSRKNCNFFCKLAAFWGRTNSLSQNLTVLLRGRQPSQAHCIRQPFPFLASPSSPGRGKSFHAGEAFCHLPISGVKPPPFGGGGIAQRWRRGFTPAKPHEKIHSDCIKYAYIYNYLHKDTDWTKRKAKRALCLAVFSIDGKLALRIIKASTANERQRMRRESTHQRTKVYFY